MKSGISDSTVHDVRGVTQAGTQRCLGLNETRQVNRYIVIWLARAAASGPRSQPACYRARSHAALPVCLQHVQVHNQSHYYSPCPRCPSPVNYDVTCQTINGSIKKTWKLGRDVYFTNWFQHHCGKKKNLETTRAIWSKPLFASCVALDQLNHDVYIFHGTPPLHYDQNHYFVPCALPLAS